MRKLLCKIDATRRIIQKLKNELELAADVVMACAIMDRYGTVTDMVS